jgi:hypothetical protein
VQLPRFVIVRCALRVSLQIHKHENKRCKTSITTTTTRKFFRDGVHQPGVSNTVDVRRVKENAVDTAVQQRACVCVWGGGGGGGGLSADPTHGAMRCISMQKHSRPSTEIALPMVLHNVSLNDAACPIGMGNDVGHPVEPCEPSRHPLSTP